MAAAEGEKPAGKPIPLPDDLTRPFWEAARERRLEIQRCRGCGYYNHPPRPMCDRCGSEDLGFAPVSGRGRIYSYTLMRQRNIRGFEDDIPYLNIIVELDEQPMLFMITNLVTGDTGQGLEHTTEGAKIGQPVEVVFEERDEGVVLPQFKLAYTTEESSD